MKIHFVQHEKFEAPGAILNWAMERNYDIGFSKLYAGERLPEAIDEIDLLIIMGGPQSPDTTLNECPHFDAEAEIQLIRNCINKGKAVLGVCLGAQLIGEAYGAKFEPSPEKEIGIFPIQLTNEGWKNEKINHFGNSLNVGHWHNDMPGLTTDCKILAGSEGCPRQIIAYADWVYGFQCHLEFTPAGIELMIAAEQNYFSKNPNHRFVQMPEKIRSYPFTQMNHQLFLFLDKLVGGYKKQQKNLKAEKFSN